MIKNLTLLLTFLIGANVLTAQDNHKYCGTADDFPWLEEYRANPEKYNVDWPEAPVYLPLTIHILGTTQGTGYFPQKNVYEALCQLNTDFLPSNLQFYVKGDFNYINNTSWYIHEEFGPGETMMRVNNKAGTVNCYFVNDPAGNCGYFSSRSDGVAMAKGCSTIGDHTWTHELGHFFSLPHTFRRWEGTTYTAGERISTNRMERVARTNCTFTADEFCDTPADYLSFRWPCDASGMSTVTQTDPNGEDFKSDGSLYMSYALDNCVSRFSLDQSTAMLANVSSVRRSLLTGAQPGPDLQGEVQPVTPEEGSNSLAGNTKLVWNSIDGASGYYVQLSRIKTFGALLAIDGIIMDTFVIAPALTAGKAYYWRIKPISDFHFCTNFNETAAFNAVLTSGNNDLNVSSVQIYPNPVSNGLLTIIDPSLDIKSNWSWKVVDANGKSTSSGQLTSKEINIKGISPGMYWLVLESDSNRKIAKVIVQ